MFQNQGIPVGGMMNITPEMNMSQPFWVEYIHVDDVDATLEKAQSLGGQIAFPAMDVSAGGRIGGFADNLGSMMAVWKPSS